MKHLVKAVCPDCGATEMVYRGIVHETFYDKKTKKSTKVDFNWYACPKCVNNNRKPDTKKFKPLKLIPRTQDNLHSEHHG